jgi:hypothetical protein
MSDVPARRTPDKLCGRARYRLASDRRDRPTSDILCGPARDRDNFFLAQVSVSFSKKKEDVYCTHATPIYLYKKRRQTTLSVSHRRRAAMCFRCRISLPCHIFVGFSAATACYHCVQIAYLLHDFDRFSYSLSTTSC